MKFWKRTARIEDPERLEKFQTAVASLNWKDSSNESVKATFTAVDRLVQEEIKFYYGARKKQRLFSIVTRGLALVLFTAGIAAPLLAGADPVLFKGIQPYGYPLLAGAGALLMVNRMFGATGGHIRYVTAQLELERLLAKFRLAWLELLSVSTHIEKSIAFKLMNDFVDKSFAVIQQETIVWGKSVQEALDQFERRAPIPGQSNEPTKKAAAVVGEGAKRQKSTDEVGAD